MSAAVVRAATTNKLDADAPIIMVAAYAEYLPNERASAEAERILYFTFVSALEGGLLRAMEDLVRVLRHAGQRLGPMGPEWLERQALV